MSNLGVKQIQIAAVETPSPSVTGGSIDSPIVYEKQKKSSPTHSL